MRFRIASTIILAVLLCQTVSSTARALSPPDSTTVLVIFARDNNDHYPMPEAAFRKAIYKRVSDFFETISYGRHHITFREALNDGGYFTSDHDAGYYKQHYERTHLRGYGMFNEEILYKVRNQYGENLFRKIDLILMMSTDGGPDWYVARHNATGYGALGFTFKTAGKTFGRSQGQGGITVEIGSDIGTESPEDDRNFSFAEITWNIAHEYGHWLKLGHRHRKVGVFSLMTQQVPPAANDAIGPNPLDIFDIIKLGWLEEDDSTRVVPVAANTTIRKVALKQVRHRRGPVVARIKLPSPHDLLLVSYHNREANRFDAIYPESGILVWHTRYRQVNLINPEPVNTGNIGSDSKSQFFINSHNADIRIPLPRAYNKPGPSHLRIALLKQSENEVMFQLRLENN